MNCVQKLFFSKKEELENRPKGVLCIFSFSFAFISTVTSLSVP